MFTGIIEQIGTVAGVYRIGKRHRLKVEADDILRDLKEGDSVSVNGVCLTLVDKERKALTFDVIEETARRSNLKNLRPGSAVNLEGPLRVGESIGGHIVSGHVDCIGIIRKISRGEPGELEVEIPSEFVKYVVGKGSIAVDGISLTVGKKKGNSIAICLIPHTLNRTTLGKRSVGDEVNIEFDSMGKYVVDSIEARKAPRLTEEFLKEKGFA